MEIINNSEPIDLIDIVNKKYVDNIISFVIQRQDGLYQFTYAGNFQDY